MCVHAPPRACPEGGEAVNDTVRCFPRSDPNFASRVEAILGSDEISEERLLATIERLREEYPRVRVVRQSSLAAEGHRLVYIYRDGHLLELPPEGPGAMRYLSPVARLLERSSDELIRAERAIAWAQVATREARAAVARRRRLVAAA